MLLLCLSKTRITQTLSQYTRHISVLGQERILTCLLPQVKHSCAVRWY